MTREECFAIWAPSGVVWSQWAKPVLFVGLEPLPDRPDPDLVDWTVPGLERVPAPRDEAIVVDLPGVDAVRAGVALARLGYRPVPLFNATDGPNAVLDLPGVDAVRAGVALARLGYRPVPLFNATDGP